MKNVGSQRFFIDIILILRFTIGETNELVFFVEIVNARFDKWIKEQERLGKIFTVEQMDWLVKIKDHIASSLTIEKDDFELSPFYEEGGLIKAYQIFGNELDGILEELNEALGA